MTTLTFCIVGVIGSAFLAGVRYERKQWWPVGFFLLLVVMNCSGALRAADRIETANTAVVL